MLEAHGIIRSRERENRDRFGGWSPEQDRRRDVQSISRVSYRKDKEG